MRKWVFFVFVIFILHGCTPQEILKKEVALTEKTHLPQDAPTLPKESPSEESTISPGSIALFYSTALRDVSHRLPVLAQNTNSGGSYTTNIQWEATDTGIVRYIPSVDRFDLMGTTTSYSYSKSSIAPFILDGRVFLIRHRASASTLTEIDPKTAKIKATIPIEDTGFAIIGDNVYYRENVRTDLFDTRTGGGALIVHNFKESVPKQVLPYGNHDNTGKLYSTADALLSVVHDTPSQTDTIRQHDLQTGKVLKTLHTGVATGRYLSAPDALYHVTNTGNIYHINRFPVAGAAQKIMTLTLDADEQGLSVDADNGKVLFVSYGIDFNVKRVLLHDITTNVTEQVTIPTLFGSASQEYQFMLLA